ncbi:hypothetical protein [Tardiphaga sp. 619_E2_N8_5]|jgi:hypothetical protein|uniref:hypothetical protein n=1 Tax=unclassified Tardiphaga TaxID=2631404 RepID=UPI003F292427
MTIVEAEAAASQIAAGLLDRIIDDAKVSLSVADAPYLSSLPEFARNPIAVAHDKLREIVEALLQFETVCEDAWEFQRIASGLTQAEEASRPYQRLRFVHSHLEYLCTSFDEAVMRFGVCYNAGLELLSADEDPVDVGSLTPGIRSNLQAAHGETLPNVGPWYTASPKSAEFPFLNTPRIASRWPDEWPSFAEFYAEADKALTREIQRCCEEMRARSTSIVLAHGPAVLELVGRHNTIVRNFQSQNHAP